MQLAISYVANFFAFVLLFYQLRQMASQLSGLPNQPPCVPNILTKNLCPTTDEILSNLKDQYLIMPSWTRPSYRYIHMHKATYTVHAYTYLILLDLKTKFVQWS